MVEARTLEQSLPIHGRGKVGTPIWGMYCLIATEGILFAYLIFTYAYLGSQGLGRWPPGGPPSLTLAIPATILLLGSSFVLEWAKRRSRDGHQTSGRIGLGVTFLMGLGFLALSLKEWSDKPFSSAQVAGIPSSLIPMTPSKIAGSSFSLSHLACARRAGLADATIRCSSPSSAFSASEPGAGGFGRIRPGSTSALIR